MGEDTKVRSKGNQASDSTLKDETTRQQRQRVRGSEQTRSRSCFLWLHPPDDRVGNEEDRTK